MHKCFLTWSVGNVKCINHRFWLTKITSVNPMLKYSIRQYFFFSLRLIVTTRSRVCTPSIKKTSLLHNIRGYILEILWECAVRFTDTQYQGHTFTVDSDVLLTNDTFGIIPCDIYYKDSAISRLSPVLWLISWTGQPARRCISITHSFIIFISVIGNTIRAPRRIDERHCYAFKKSKKNWENVYIVTK